MRNVTSVVIAVTSDTSTIDAFHVVARDAVFILVTSTLTDFLKVGSSTSV